jgi:GNAT superfamily N-acetyltransferase
MPMPRDRSHQPFVLRPARAEDKPGILAFCQRTYEWGDYVPEVLDDWLADERGQLLVAAIDGVPVGVAYVVLLAPTEAWLQGLRVHPEHRRKGLAHQFLGRCLDVARQRGARVARLATGSSNVAVHRTVERAGMRRVAVVWVLEASATADADAGLALVPLTLQDWPLVSRYILASSTLAQMGGLYGMWDLQTLSEDILRDHLERGQVFGLWEKDHLTGTAIILDVDERWPCLSLAYVDAANSHGQKLARALRHRPAGLGLEMVEVMVPSASPLHHALLQAGFETAPGSQHEMWIYELDWLGTAS